MKKNVILSVLFLCFIIGACSSGSDDEIKKVTAIDIEAIKAAVTNCSWVVSYYLDSNKEETSDYNGYTFTFNADGSLGVTNGTTSVSGAWSILNDDNSTDDSSDDSVELKIFFSSPEILVELSDDWDITKYTSSMIDLLDVSGGDGTTDFLTFTKK